jgi:hypothetical protein
MSILQKINNSQRGIELQKTYKIINKADGSGFGLEHVFDKTILTISFIDEQACIKYAERNGWDLQQK